MQYGDVLLLLYGSVAMAAADGFEEMSLGGGALCLVSFHKHDQTRFGVLGLL